MKIGIFTDLYYPQIGGVTSSIVTLKEELIKRGHDVTIVTVKVPGHIDNINDKIIRIPSVKFSDLHVGYYINPSIIKKLDIMDFDVIHTHTEFFVGMIGAKIAKKKNIPLLHTCHTIYDVYINSLLSNYPIKKIVSHMFSSFAKNHTQKCDSIVVPSYKTKEAIVSFNINEKVSVIPSGIKINKFLNNNLSNEDIKLLKVQLGLHEDDKVILSLSRITKEKRIDVIINQFYKVLEQTSNTKLVIIGDGQEKKYLERLCVKLKIDNHVKFLGEIPWERIELYYKISDIFVSASKVETQGLTIIEAMASGVPVVVFNDKNITGVVEDKITGRLFSNDENLSKLLCEVLTYNKDENITIDNAYNVAKLFSAEQYAINIERLYQKLLFKYSFTKKKTIMIKNSYLGINDEVS